LAKAFVCSEEHRGHCILSRLIGPPARYILDL
jgi:hypothetical protein